MNNIYKLLHPGYPIVKPLQQGELDGFCGIYSVINAIRIVYAPVNKISNQSCKSLFKDAINFINDHSDISVAARWGITEKVQHNLILHLSHSKNLKNLPPLRVKRYNKNPENLKILTRKVESAITDNGVILTALYGRFSHYSTICGVNQSGLLFFDSIGIKEIKNKSLIFGDDTTKSKFKVTNLITIGI